MSESATKPKGNSRPVTGRVGNECCVQCEKKTNGKLAQCWFCAGWLHHKCINLPDGAEQFLASDYCILTCQKCHVKTLDVLKMQSETQGCLNEFQASVTHNHQELSSSISKLNEELVALKKQVNVALVTNKEQNVTYAAVATKLGSQLDSIKDWPSASATTASPYNPVVLQDTMLSSLHESADRERRKRNVIVFNLAESTTAQADQADTTQFIQLCKDELNMDIVVENAYRLGKPQSDKVRPLVVRLSDEELRRRLLRKAKELHQSDNKAVNKVFIRPDLTKVQQAENKKLYAELATRIRADPTKRYQIRNGGITTTEGKNEQSTRLVRQTTLLPFVNQPSTSSFVPSTSSSA